VKSRWKRNQLHPTLEYLPHPPFYLNTLSSMPPKSKAVNRSASSSAPLPADPVLANRPVEPIVETPPVVAATPKATQKLAYPVPAHISPATINNTQSLLRFVILGLICAAAIASRLFAVIRFESVIHEL
jgi:dolichyl-diphosphooligosaccharide--protein glycosyltransferase